MNNIQKEIEEKKKKLESLKAGNQGYDELQKLNAQIKEEEKKKFERTRLGSAIKSFGGFGKKLKAWNEKRSKKLFDDGDKDEY